MITMLVGRCHVSDSYVEVLRYVRSRIKRGAWCELSREQRREIVRDVIAEHRANRECYMEVMYHRTWGTTGVLGGAR